METLCLASFKLGLSQCFWQRVTLGASLISTLQALGEDRAETLRKQFLRIRIGCSSLCVGSSCGSFFSVNTEFMDILISDKNTIKCSLQTHFLSSPPNPHVLLIMKPCSCCLIDLTWCVLLGLCVLLPAFVDASALSSRG